MKIAVPEIQFMAFDMSRLENIVPIEHSNDILFSTQQDRLQDSDVMVMGLDVKLHPLEEDFDPFSLIES